MIQEQIRRKRRILSKGKPNKGEEETVDPPIIDGTLEEIDQALARSESILKRPTEKVSDNFLNLPNDEIRRLINKQQKGRDIVHRTCSC